MLLKPQHGGIEPQDTPLARGRPEPITAHARVFRQTIMATPRRNLVADGAVFQAARTLRYIFSRDNKGVGQPEAAWGLGD